MIAENFHKTHLISTYLGNLNINRIVEEKVNELDSMDSNLSPTELSSELVKVIKLLKRNKDPSLDKISNILAKHFLEKQLLILISS